MTRTPQNGVSLTSSPDTLNILFIGDIFGEPGRRAVKHFVPELRERHKLDLVLANCENAAAGRGISKRLADEIAAAGVDFMTSGNHVYRVQDCFPYLNDPACKVLRPYNFPRSSPGRGTAIVTSPRGVRVGLINLMGRVFMDPGVDLPFPSFEQALMELRGECDIVIMDFHAEASAEKRAMGWLADGRVQLVVGTHTHVPTADEEILPGGAAYITDLGMCGPYDSVIGMRKDIVLKRMCQNLPGKFEVAEGDVRLCGIVCSIDVARKRAVSIQRVCERL